MTEPKIYVRFLKSTGPEGDTGDIVAAVKLRDPYECRVTAEGGVTSKLYVKYTTSKKFHKGAEITITMGPDTQTGILSQITNWKEGSNIEAQTHIYLVDPITVPEPGYSEHPAFVTPKPPPDTVADGFKALDDIETVAYKAKPPRFAGDGGHRFCVSGGNFGEKTDNRESMTIEGPGGETGKFQVSTHASDSIALTFTVRKPNGDVKLAVNRPGWTIEDHASDIEYAVPIVNGIGTHDFSLATARRVRLGNSKLFNVAEPVVLNIVET